MVAPSESTPDSIAIVGIGCRFPGARNPAEFWGLLCRGEDRITEFPPERLDPVRFYSATPLASGKSITKWGGFLSRIDGFDWRAFGISPREATSMDPQHRLLLEVAWEALEDAGAPLESVAGSRTGVLLGLMFEDYRAVTRGSLSQIDGYTVASNTPSFAANRISFLFDLLGTSLTLDAACASSHAALHLACDLIRSGEIEGALVGAANLLIAPDPFISLSRASALSPTGRCHTFDGAADGFVRGEGAAVMYLKPLRSAIANHDRIYAVIAASAVGHKGAGAWIQEPSAKSQESVIRRALERAGLRGKDLDYVELHGTGTPRGDPEEARALGAVISEGRDARHRCIVGSVKTNVGHLDAAAGLAGIVKVALALHHGAIPPSLNFRTMNPEIDAVGLHLEVSTTLQPWPRDGDRVAGVTSVGLGGVCGHAVLRSFASGAVAFIPAAAKYILPLSARSAGALHDVAGRFAEFVEPLSGAQLHDVCYTAARRRTHHGHRICAVGAGAAEIAQALRAYTRGDRPPSIFTQQSDEGHRTVSSVSNGNARSELETFAHAFCQGHSVPWTRLFAAGRVVSAPTYCWQRERLWLDEPAKYGVESALREPGGHPFVRSHVEVVEPPGHVWEAQIDARAHPYLLDHRVRGSALVPASVFIEILLRALSELAPIASIELRDIRFKRGIVLAPDSVIQLSIHYAQPSTGSVGVVRVHSREGSAWVENVTASAAINEGLESGDLESGDVFDVRPSDSFLPEDAMDGAACYDHLASRGFNPGPSFRRIERVRRGSGVLLADVSGGGVGEESFLFHPAVQDACMHLLLLGLPGPADVAHVPVAVQRLRMLQTAVRGDVRSRAAIEDRPTDAHTVLGRVSIHDRGGPVLEARGIELAPLTVEQSSTREALERWCYEIEWRPITPSGALPKPVGTWVVWLDVGGLGSRVSDALRRGGCRVIEVVDRPYPVAPTGERCVIGSTSPDALRQGIESLLDSVPDLSRFLYIAPPAATYDPSVSGDFESGACAVWAPALAIAQCLLRSSSPAGRLWFITQAAHRTADPTQGALWGLARSLVFDLSPRWGGIVDIDDPSEESTVDLLLAAMEIELSTGDEILLRGSKLLCPRLAHVESSGSDELRVDAEGLYVVTGGLGGLGLCAAERLAQRGARRIALVGRTPLPERSEWQSILDDRTADARLQRQISSLRRLEALGANATVHPLDVGDAQSFASWLQGIRASTRMPLRGFVHAAGVFGAVSLEDITDAVFLETMRPKCAPLVALEHVASELDFVALFSSAASVINSPRVSHYAAANAFLDFFAARMRSRGVRAVSFNWGLWAEVGLIERVSGSSHPARMRTVRSIPPTVGTDLFEHFLAGALTQVLVWPTDWNEWAKTYPSLSSVPLFSDYVRRASVAPHARRGEADWLAQFVHAPAGDRQSIVLSFLRRQVEAALRLPLAEHDDDAPLEDLGLDSLLSIEIRAHVQRAFSVDPSAFEFTGRASLRTATEQLLATLNSLYPALYRAPEVDLSIMSRSG